MTNMRADRLAMVGFVGTALAMLGWLAVTAWFIQRGTSPVPKLEWAGVFGVLWLFQMGCWMWLSSVPEDTDFKRSRY